MSCRYGNPYCDGTDLLHGLWCSRACTCGTIGAGDIDRRCPKHGDIPICPVARADALYVLSWLYQCDAPSNIISLQKRVFEALGVEF